MINMWVCVLIVSKHVQESHCNYKLQFVTDFEKKGGGSLLKLMDRYGR